MPGPMIATDMFGAIARSKSGSNNTNVNRCKKCDSTNVYEIEEPEGKVIGVYTVCENCGNKEKIREKKKSMLKVPMITIFNRRELVVTMDMNRQAQIRDKLSQHHIDYVVRTENLLGSASAGRGHGGSMGINLDYSYEYKIYVHKKDFEAAKGLLQL